MDAKLIGVALALALLGSANVFADQQRFGRDSVYATPGTTTYPSRSNATVGTIRPGRSSVFANDAPVPSPPSKVANTVVLKPGRA